MYLKIKKLFILILKYFKIKKFEKKSYNLILEDKFRFEAFHSTKTKFEEFDSTFIKNNNLFGKGFYFTSNYENACNFNIGNIIIMICEITLHKPLYLKYSGNIFNGEVNFLNKIYNTDDIQFLLNDRNINNMIVSKYDGLIVDTDIGFYYIVFSSKQIKILISEEPDIYKF